MYRDMKEVTVEKENVIKPGDTVRLKSGGPVMTVEQLIPDREGDKVSCVWFEKYASRSSRENFLAIMLEKVVEAK